MVQYEEKLFAYGTLLDSKLQRSLFKRELQGRPDVICGYRLDRLRIRNANELSVFGENFYPIIHPTGKNSDRVPGILYVLSRSELKRADFYEGEEYRRVKLLLMSGEYAWVYVAA